MLNNDYNDDPLHEPVYTIGHAAKKLGVSVPTLRMYEQTGLIMSFRTETNRRLFSRHDLYHIQIIIDLINVFNQGVMLILYILKGVYWSHSP